MVILKERMAGSADGVEARSCVHGVQRDVDEDAGLAEELKDQYETQLHATSMVDLATPCSRLMISCPTGAGEQGKGAARGGRKFPFLLPRDLWGVQEREESEKRSKEKKADEKKLTLMSE
eukprot:760947-Hanusia_phi.AAC.1